MRQQIDNLIDRVGHAGIEKCLFVVFVFVHHSGKLFRQGGSAERHHPFDLRFIDDRHDARLDRNVHTCNLDVFLEGIEGIVVEKELGNQMLHPTVHLLFQIGDILDFVLRFRVAFRITGATDGKITVLPDEFDQIAGVPEVLLFFHGRIFIPAQGKNAIDFGLFQFLQQFADFEFRRIQASQDAPADRSRTVA